MFYVKERLSDTTEIMVQIHYNNVFCACPGCGCPVQVDLADLFSDDDADLYSSSVYCPDCSQKLMEERR